VGQGSPLFPDDAKQEVESASAAAVRLGSLGRMRVTRRLMASSEALEAAAPLPHVAGTRWLRRGVAYAGAAYLAHKYQEEADDDAIADQMRAMLADLRDHLQTHEHVVGGRLTFADLSWATMLQFVRPVDRWVRLSEPERRAWNDPVVAEGMDAIFEWRDGIFERYWKR
jgi:glutathione S-transferase